MNTIIDNRNCLNSNLTIARVQQSSRLKLNVIAALFALLSTSMLTACGGNGIGGNDVDYISAQPLSAVMRPGETENVQLTSTVDEDPGFFGSFIGGNEITEDDRIPCVTPDPKCRVAIYSAATTVTTKILDIMGFSFTGIQDDFSKFDESILPFSIFPATTETLPPAIRIAAGGLSDFSQGREGYLGEIGHSLAVAADGTTWAWGINDFGQLGNGGSRHSSLPVQVQTAENFVAVAAGGLHSMAIAVDGTVWAWGDNRNGQLGDSTQEARNVPVQVQNLNNNIAIAAGDYHSLSLRVDGTVWAWGRNFEGQLGDRSREDRQLPVQVQNLNNIIAIAAGDTHSLALDSAGAVWAWGNNSDGQVAGFMRSDDSKVVTTPRQVQDLGAVSSIAAGEGYSLALRNDGSVWSWGSNAFRQLGRASTDPCATDTRCPVIPHRVTGLGQVLDIAAGGRFAIARRTDGTVWTWGDNEYGQVAGLPGLGTLTPIQKPGIGNILSIAAGSAHAIAMSADEACTVGAGRTGGKLMAWGNNVYGARGDGTAVNWLRPTPVVALGDDSSCANLTGNRLIIYKAGTGDGTIESDIPGLICTGMMCWQSVTAGFSVMLTATADGNSAFADWYWDCAGNTQSMRVSMDRARVCKVRFERVASSTQPPPAQMACNDGVDNDDDGLVDLNDPGCSSADDDSELNNPAASFTLTINITGEGEVFDNNDNSFFCFSDGSASCVQTYSANSLASLRGISFGIEDVAIWTSGCDNGNGVLEACSITMNQDKIVTIDMQ